MATDKTDHPFNLEHDPETGEVRGDQYRFDEEAARQAEADADRYEGQRIRSYIAPSNFLAGQPLDFLARFRGVPKGGGYMRLGLMEGELYATEERTVDLNGNAFQYGASVWLEGHWDAIIDISGDLMQSRFAILPKFYGQTVHRVFQQAIEQGGHPQGTRLNLEIGIESSGGKGVGYQYVITEFRQRKPNSTADRLRARREELRALDAQNKPKLISNG